MPDTGPFDGETPSLPSPPSSPTAIDLDSSVHVSPYALFRWLRSGRPVLLVDVRPVVKALDGPGRLSLADAVPHPESGSLEIPPHRDVVLFDDDGDRATHLARRYRERGHLRVRSLFGGLSLYDYALDPLVVGHERHLAGSPTQ